MLTTVCCNPSEAMIHIIPSLRVLHSKVMFLKASCTLLRGKAAEQQDVRGAENQSGIRYDMQVCAKLGSNV